MVLSRAEYPRVHTRRVVLAYLAIVYSAVGILPKVLNYCPIAYLAYVPASLTYVFHFPLITKKYAIRDSRVRVRTFAHSHIRVAHSGTRLGCSGARVLGYSVRVKTI